MRAVSSTVEVVSMQEATSIKDQDKESKTEESKNNQPPDAIQLAPPKAHSSSERTPPSHIPTTELPMEVASICITCQPPSDLTTGTNGIREFRDITSAHLKNGNVDPNGLHLEETPASATTPKHVTIAEETDDESMHPHHSEHSNTPSPFKTTSRNRGASRDSSYDELHGRDRTQGPEFDMDQDGHQYPSDEKYRRLKRKLKEVLEENERMSQELEKTHRRVRNLRREKNLLLDRLCALEQRDSDSGSDSLSHLSSDSDSSDSSASEEILYKRTPQSRVPTKMHPQKNLRGSGAVQPTAASSGTTTHHPKKTATKTNQQTSTVVSGAPRSGAKDTKSQASVSTPSTITNVGSATQKPKRVHQTNKQRPGLAKVRKVQALERDEAGNVKLPVTVGIITIMDIGHVVYDREAFHNDRYIFPVGYKMSRSYNSMIDPHNLTTYTCSVIDDGEAPKFQIDAADQPGKPIIAGTATGAWTHVVKAANAIRRRDHSNSASGPDYFGFSNATIAKMIQDLPNADKCETYVMQRFEEPSAVTAPTKAPSAGVDKRKASALSSRTGEDDGAQGEEHEDEVEDDDDEYTTLGTPGKKPKIVSSPRIRHAGIDGLPTVTSKKQEVVIMEEHDELEHDNSDGDETQSEADPAERKMSASTLIA
ncbi:hypothetical protein BGX28_010501, partial [Mortierella sp. GBA30]